MSSDNRYLYNLLKYDIGYYTFTIDKTSDNKYTYYTLTKQSDSSIPITYSFRKGVINDRVKIRYHYKDSEPKSYPVGVIEAYKIRRLLEKVYQQQLSSQYEEEANNIIANIYHP